MITVWPLFIRPHAPGTSSSNVPEICVISSRSLGHWPGLFGAVTHSTACAEGSNVGDPLPVACCAARRFGHFIAHKDLGREYSNPNAASRLSVTSANAFFAEEARRPVQETASSGSSLKLSSVEAATPVATNKTG